MRILITFILLSNICLGQGTWVQKNNLGGIERYGAVGFSVNGKGYVGLGKGTSWLDLYEDLWEYDPVTDSWTQKADFPGGKRDGALGIGINGKGYIGTGMDPDQIIHSDWWEYNAQNNLWTQKASFPGGSRFYMNGFDANNAVFVGLGSNISFNTFNDWWKYDPSTNSWQQQDNLPGPTRTLSTGFTLNDQIYICTGLNVTNNGNYIYLNDLWKFDPINNSWEQKNNFPGPKRAEAHGFSLGNSGYLGLGTKFIGSGTVSDIWRYNPNLDTWQQISNFEGGLREMVSGFTIDCKHYVCAGWINDQEQQNDLWEFSLDTCYTEPPIEPVVENNAYIIPNVFTPNNDDVNDFWSTNFKDDSEYLIILNRWGQVIIRLDLDNPKWDGKSEGEPCPEGVYFYRGNIRGEEKSGFFHLLR
jgi:gliding motility-associated-like protein